MFDKFFNDSSQKTTIYCPEGTVEKLEEIFKIIFPTDLKQVSEGSNIEFKEFNKLENEEILPNVFVDSYDVDHGNCKPAYGFTIRKENKVVGISGDSKLCTEIEQIVEKSDVSILDTSFIDEGQVAHMGLDDIYKLLDKYKDKTIIPTHMHDETKEKAISNQKDNFIVLNDGEDFEW